jgi:4-hydroxy-tetrahydrodipicolinate reductase
MNIALVGYGKMGKAIEAIALEKGHQTPLKIDRDNRNELTTEALRTVDVVIEFSRPEVAFDNISACLQAGVPVVSGTTGWLDRMDDIRGLVADRESAFFYASNFSIGVNILFAVNKYLGALMNNHPTYDISIKETHHTQKLDAPSGTAITLAEALLERLDVKRQWVNQETTEKEALPIVSSRIDDVPGTHQITYSSSIDTIELIHTAHSRLGFAQGALMAAEWLPGKTGVFGMSDLLGF